MKQTESAVRMLISAYKAVLTNCYIKENLLGGGKRLVKGAALSSFLTAVLAGVSSSYSYAETISVTEGETKNYVDKKEYEFEPDNEEDSTIDITKGNLFIGNKIHESHETYTDKVLIDSNKFGIHVIGKDISNIEEASQVQISATTEIVIQQSETTLQNETSAIYVKDRANVKLEVDLPESYKESGSDSDGNILIQAQGNQAAYGINIKGSVDLDNLEVEDSIYSDDESKQIYYPYIEIDQNKIPSVVLDNGYGDNRISGVGYAGGGIGVQVDRGRLDVKADKGSNTILGTKTAIDAKNFSRIEIGANTNIIGTSDSIKGGGKNAILLDNYSSIDITADNENKINATNLGISVENMSDATLRIHYDRGNADTENKVLSNIINVTNSDGEDAIGLQASNGSYIKFEHRGSGGSSDSNEIYLPKINNIINVSSDGENVVGLKTDDSESEREVRYSNIDIVGTTLEVSAIGDNSTAVSGIESIGNNKLDTAVSVVVDDRISINVNTEINKEEQYVSSGSAKQGSGVNTKDGGIVNLKSNNSGITIYSLSKNQEKATGFGVISDGGKVFLNSLKNTVVGSLDGVNFSSGTVDITSSATSLLSRSIDKVSDYNIIIGSDGTGVHAAEGADGEFNAIATSGNNYIAGAENAIWSEPSEEVKEPKILVKAEYGSNFIGFDKDVYVDGVVGKNGIYAQSGEVTIKAGVRNEVNSYQKGIFVDNLAKVNLISGELNLITAKNNPYEEFGKGYAIYSLSGGSVTLEAGDTNQLVGAVYASGSDTNVFIGGSEEDENRAARENLIYSYAYISGAGDLGDDPEGAFEGKNVISALYAEGGANIELSGISNELRTYAKYKNKDQLERVVWAYNGKVGEENAKGTSISIKGYSYIATDFYEKSFNSLDIAIAAGTAVDLKEDDVNTPINLEDRAKVELTYADLVNEDGSTRHSFISGDILSAYDGLVNINPKNGSNAGINIEGNLLAGNNGILNVNLGNGGTLTGRADDYGDSGVENLNGGHQNMTFFDPAFSSKIFSGGEVNLTMGENSRWNVTGQSWITRINTSYDEISDSTARIDLIPSNTDRNEAAHSLTVYELSGNAIFNMSLDADRNVSDMLYIKNADGNYTVNVIDAVSQDDMYAGGLDGLRFATVGTGSNASFRAITYNGGGINNIEYRVGTDAYTGNDENVVYNGDGMTEHKPGDDTVDGFFESDGEPGATTPATQAVSLAAVSPLAEESTTTAADSGLEEVTNFKLIGVESSEISDAGKTVIDMSRANYANAVYMDTLNKRQGEARFVGDTDHGVWVRLRHDNIGKDDSFRSHNTMVEVGFEQRDANDYGEFHTGFALDYMNGSLDYHTVDGDGDIERYGVWFYTTYLGNDGQYADLVLKYGHLKNDFDFNLAGTGVNVNGDYTNEVASISAEYGWKFSNSYNYYIEPQAQLQYSYVTGADYTTSYGTKVDLDSIHSLIGRVGFRAGKDFNTETPITAYIRGDVLHEFLGDQDIYAYDNTGVMDVTYENDDTWYSAGVGLSVQSSENTYFFIEGEQVFGADNDNTYTVSGGFKHSF